MSTQDSVIHTDPEILGETPVFVGTCQADCRPIELALDFEI